MSYALVFAAGFFWKSHVQKEIVELYRKIKARL
jgi:hypothetical protein